jgi:hypothetical protein
MEADTIKALPRCDAVNAMRQSFVAPALTMMDSTRGFHLSGVCWAIAGALVHAVDASMMTTSIEW